MYLKEALEIIVAFFSVIGIYALWRMISQRVFGDKNIVIAIEILCRRDAEDAEALIKEALGMFLSLRSQRIVIITTPELKDNGVLTDAVKKYGVGLYVSEN